MTTRTDIHTVLGTMHSHELLMLSLIRALPPEIRQRAIDDFQAQVEQADLPHLSADSERETIDACRAHLRKMSIVLSAISS
ncbi:hypothetical protein WKR88_16820 [Trinickia caryophylli]|uniref:Uncharacterized protein n=1 Tax=Trinickia caryophylli TaxID=28094 RepID=A0A1X7GDQ7_TRICW|nr:hypothetical protein [Trinickia caryophylli]PMS10796.1 hypothetical protein C0Z17_18075 [Trinickia caryophylli]TRX13827.1 hypothetical protein FNF07_20885 [Trinickia caryophylli]WQE15418.1 hypothetical protein U0034_23090 [Trinickia caryophylli]SMF68002.1 hypothetical protein SAMN06295900_11551 [Trinickia caryophylli]GLU33847.1 hypothetical protein Busp01_36890 [Trinickia caryophylli]